ncbi:ABC transporter permease [Mucilaginibacter segetis]|uniref:ABC transporter permease n=1 Tax=Mucilaginibacter segetis TaxID=2793071 RepID=A0A934PR82_9SPHI|nr:ABC transporter permease [Mucilaginibacter segetis]MBK0378644.1 ABC transporter permease [Mucilaginibacter segetis]
MIKNLFKTAWRNISRQRSYTLINIIGLGAGISVCLVIFVLIQFHSGFDNFHTKKDRIYRLLTEYHHADSKDIFYGYGIARAVPRAIKNDIPEIEEIVPIYQQNDEQIQVLNGDGQIDKKFKEARGVVATTPAFFKVFDFPLLEGDKTTALRDPNSVILSKETAEKYFGDWHQAMGKSIKWNNHDVLKVNGILATIPKNTDFQFNVIISMGTGPTAGLLKSDDYNSTGTYFGCYALTKPNVTEAHLTNSLRAFIKKHRAPENQDSEVAQPLSKVHFDTIGNYSESSISPQMIKMLWLIAVFILIIACVNFVNLATAQAVNRAKEVGIRKVLGGNRGQLQVQFLTETFVIVLLSLVLAGGISMLAIPAVGKIMQLPLTAGMLLQIKVAVFVVVLAIVVTLLAGFYPSLVLSGFNPINALKSKTALKGNTKGISLRHALVVFQFIIAQGLIICTLIIVKQMNYFNNTSMGFAKDAIVNVPFPADSVGISKLDYLKKRITDINGVQELSLSSNVPAGEDANWTMFTFENAVKPVDFYSIIKFADAEYLPSYKLQLAAGRNLAPSDTVKEFLVNEAVVQKLGIRDPKDVLNKQIKLGKFAKGVIVGVLKNYHNRSFKEDYAPLLLTTFKNQYQITNIKLSASNLPASLNAIEKLWNEVYPDYAFEYQFLDEHIANFYKQENQLSKIYECFAIVAIMLSCLGLYGLASFMAVQRIKEVGIRKVLGASVSGILYLFSKEFIVLIGIGFVIATPIAWYLMSNWLQDYTYRIQIHWEIFAVAGIIAIVIALATISFQLIRAALTNPVKSLRSE